MKRSPDELFIGLMCCADRARMCRKCPYYGRVGCRKNLLCDAASYVLMNERGKHMFDKCVDVKDVPFGTPYEKMEGNNVT